MMKKMHLVLWAMGKRAQGYRLLKNDKSSDALAVTMLKWKKWLAADGVLHCTYERVQRDFSQNTGAVKEMLFTEKDLNWPMKKEISYYNLSSDGKMAHKGNLDNERAHLDRENYDNLKSDMLKNDRARAYYEPQSAWSFYVWYLLDPFFSNRLWSTDRPARLPFRPNVFVVLSQNLKSKGK